jgi:hypothetical protein
MPNVIDGIADHSKPGDTASWWSQQGKLSMAGNLDPEETAYLELFTSTDVPQALRIGRGIADITNLTQEEKDRAKKHFGEGPGAIGQFVNYENRRRIIAHYVYTHPATIQYELGLYRLTRDVIPPLFLAERVYELFTAEEAFTGEKVSRLRAGADLLVAIVLARVLKAAAGANAPVRPQSTPLTDPIYDLPPQGGMRINGRWYTEHALERMAPDTPQIRAELRTRAAARLAKLGINPGHGAYDACIARALQKIDPRGIPPAVVEAEISSPGSTNVKVITARRQQVVVTVMPKGGN